MPKISNKNTRTKNATSKTANRKKKNMKSTAGGTLTKGTTTTAKGSSYISGEPRISATYDRCVIRHREYIEQVLGSATSHSPVNQLCNPKNSSLFPWLATEALKWEKFRFNKIRFIFQAVCPSTTPGYMLIHWDPNATDDNSSQTHATLLQSRYNSFGSVWMSHSLEVPAQTLDLFTSANSTAAVQDARLSNYGQVLVKTGNGSTGVYLGDLFIEYEVEFRMPQAVHPSASTISMSFESQFWAGDTPAGTQGTGHSTSTFPPRVLNLKMEPENSYKDYIAYTPDNNYFVIPGGYLYYISIFRDRVDASQGYIPLLNIYKAEGDGSLTLVSTAPNLTTASLDTSQYNEQRYVYFDARSMSTKLLYLEYIGWNTVNYPVSALYSTKQLVHVVGISDPGANFTEFDGNVYLPATSTSKSLGPNRYGTKRPPPIDQISA